MKYLITGGSGFIGSALTDALIIKGHKVAIISLLHAKQKKNLNRKAKLYECSIKESNLDKIFKQEQPKIIFHLSGPINLRKNPSEPDFNKSIYFFEECKKILDYSKLYNVKKLIFASSGGAIYENASTIPTPETETIVPASLYGLANLIIEKLIQRYYHIYNQQFTILRFSNIYGPRQWENGIIPSLITHCIKNMPPIIHGNGEQTRDFLYIDDVVDALCKASKIKTNGIFNVGSGTEITINNLFQKIIKITNSSNKKPDYQLHLNAGAQRSCINISKAQKVLKWQPFTNLQEGLEKTIVWFHQNILNNQTNNE